MTASLVFTNLRNWKITRLHPFDVGNRALSFAQRIKLIAELFMLILMVKEVLRAQPHFKLI